MRGQNKRQGWSPPARSRLRGCEGCGRALASSFCSSSAPSPSRQSAAEQETVLLFHETELLPDVELLPGHSAPDSPPPAAADH